MRAWTLVPWELTWRKISSECKKWSLRLIWEFSWKHFLFSLSKSNILTDTSNHQYPDNKLTEQQTSERIGEKSDEVCEKYVIEEPEGVKDEYDDDGDKRDDSEKVKSNDKKNNIEKLPPGWEKHEGQCSVVYR